MDIEIIQTDRDDWVGVVFTDQGIFNVTDEYPTEQQVQDDIDKGLIDLSLIAK